MKKRFRIRPLRYDSGQCYWIGGPDAGRTGAMKVLTVKLDCGETIDHLLSLKHRHNIEKLIYGRTTTRVRPSYPEH